MKIALDIDNVLAHGGHPYADCRPDPTAVRVVAQLRARGHEVVLHTSRYTSRCGNDLPAARAMGEAELRLWLAKHAIEVDGVEWKIGACLYACDKSYRLDSRLGAGEWRRLLRFLEEGEPAMVLPGDVVELRSGGPPMTVRSVADGVAVCDWFDADGDMARGEFPLEMVEETEQRFQLDPETMGRAISEEDV